MAEYATPINVLVGMGKVLRRLMVFAIILAGLVAILPIGLALHLKLMAVLFLLAVGFALAAHNPKTEGLRLTIYPSGRAEVFGPDASARTVSLAPPHWLSAFGSVVRVRAGERLLLRLLIVPSHQAPGEYRRLLVLLRHGQ